MDKLEEYYHEFKGYGIHDSRIKVHIYEGFVILQDLGEGTSVTNAAEQLATEILQDKELDPGTKWLEVYPYYSHSCAEIRFEYVAMSRKYMYPKWYPATKEILTLVKSIPDEKKQTEPEEKK